MRVRYKKPEQIDAQNIETSWERLPTETAKAFSAFVMYRDAGPHERSLTLVAKNLNPGRPISVQAISEWAIKHRWKDRAWAFDWYSQEQARLELAALRREARQRQIRLAVAMQKVGSHAIAELLAKLQNGVPLNLTPSQITSLAKAGMELEQAALGEGHDDRVIPKISVILPDGKELRCEQKADPDDEPPKKPN